MKTTDRRDRGTSDQHRHAAHSSAFGAFGSGIVAGVSNLFLDHLKQETACHDGQGRVAVFRPYQRAEGSPLVDFIDLVVIPPGATIGRHFHGDNVEWYVILAGSGKMWFDNRSITVGPGDILVNPPYGEHGLANESEGDIQLLVFQLSRHPQPLDH